MALAHLALTLRSSNIAAFNAAACSKAHGAWQQAGLFKPLWPTAHLAWGCEDAYWRPSSSS